MKPLTTAQRQSREQQRIEMAKKHGWTVRQTDTFGLYGLFDPRGIARGYQHNETYENAWRDDRWYGECLFWDERLDLFLHHIRAAFRALNPWGKP